MDTRKAKFVPQTFEAHTSEGKVYFSVRSVADLFEARKQAMEVCDKYDWTLGKVVWL